MMNDEELRFHAVAVAGGDVTKAQQIYDFIRPARDAEPGEGLAQSALAETKPAPAWTTSATRWYAVLSAGGGRLVHVEERDNDLSVEGAANGLRWKHEQFSWDYEVYAFDMEAQQSGYLGTAERMDFVDAGIVPDLSRPLPAKISFPYLDEFISTRSDETRTGA